jgi:hypothetical protein
MEPSQTANALYKYDTEYNGETVEKLVQECHQYNCKINGWHHQKLKVGCFGFDNLVVSLCYALDKIDSESTENQIAEWIHQGWAINYIYWRDHNHWEKEASRNKLAKPLNDDRRNLCLPNDEKEKDLIIARWIQKKFF